MTLSVPSSIQQPQEISSKILSKLNEASNQTLNAQLASAWVEELEASIQQTKARIHQCIEHDLQAFNRQFESAKSVQSRVRTLDSTVNSLHEMLSDQQKGLIPHLINDLRAHSSLAQEMSDAEVTLESAAHLKRSWGEVSLVFSLIDAGKLPDAVKASVVLEALLNQTPLPLCQAKVMKDLKRSFGGLKDRIERHLTECYLKCVTISPSELIIRPVVQVDHSEVLLPTSAIISSLSTTSLTTHINNLRRDLISYYIERLIQKPTQTTISYTDAMNPEAKFALSPSLSNSEKLADRLQNLSALLSFLNKNLFPHLRASNAQDFPTLLCQPITKAVLEHLLVPSIPSFFAALPPFLDLVQFSVDFEEKYLVQLLGSTPQDRPIKEWANGVSGHYERKRRVDLLEEARALVLKRDGMPPHTFRAEHCQDDQPERQVGFTANDSRNDEKVPESDIEGHIGADESAWGFEAEAEMGSQKEKEAHQEVGRHDNEDPGDAWGLDDDEESWDDAWDDTRVSSSKESYQVSERTRDVISIVGRILQEAKELLTSNVFPSALSLGSPPGTMLLQAALSPLDLFRALYPIAFAAELSSSPARSMRLSNDFIYLGLEVGKMSTSYLDLIVLKDRWHECEDHLKSLGDSFFEDNLDKQRRYINEVLDATQGFTDTAEQDRYDECEDTINKVLKHIRAIAQEWKPVLPYSKYFTAIGSIADAAILRLIADILALPDITEVESHRLSELCRILNALEGLFSENGGQSSLVVQYVHGWLKFSYLTEFLEASIADISYLFEEGALVDFEITELVKLIRALFADTPLRNSTINKIMQGHPLSDSIQ